MKNRIAFCFFATCARALRAAQNLTSRTGACLCRAHYAVTKKTAHLNLAIINERRG